jgi:hypothetical protein
MSQEFSPENIQDIARFHREGLGALRESILIDPTEGLPPSTDGEDGLSGDREPRDPKIPPSAGAMALELVDNE